MATIAVELQAEVKRLQGLADLLLGIVGAPAAAPAIVAWDPSMPCPHPAAARVVRGTLARPQRSFCQQCQEFLEE
jgi:hypothetical protein